ncbi:MAG TPA: hypothetical protein VIN05_01875 [Roseovarius sp.]
MSNLIRPNDREGLGRLQERCRKFLAELKAKNPTLDFCGPQDVLVGQFGAGFVDPAVILRFFWADGRCENARSSTMFAREPRGHERHLASDSVVQRIKKAMDKSQSKKAPLAVAEKTDDVIRDYIGVIDGHVSSCADCCTEQLVPTEPRSKCGLIRFDAKSPRAEALVVPGKYSGDPGGGIPNTERLTAG